MDDIIPFNDLPEGIAETFLTGINTYSSVEPYMNAITGLNSVWQTASLQRFKNFHSSYMKNLCNEGDVSKREKHILQFRKYLENEKNLNFVYESARIAVQKHSEYSSILLGTMTGLIVREERNISVLEITLLDAIASLNDFELRAAIDLFEKLLDKFDGLEEDTDWEKRLVKIISLYRSDELQNERSILLAVRKMLRTDILEYYQSSNSDRMFLINSVTKSFWMLIKVSDIIPLIKKEMPFERSKDVRYDHLF